MPLVIPAAGGSSSAAATEILTPAKGSDEEVVTEQSKKVKKRRFSFTGPGIVCLSFVAPPSQENEGFLDSSARTNLQICTTVESSSALAIPVDTTAAATTSTGAAATTNLATNVNPNLAGPSYPEDSKGSDDSFYSPTTLDLSEAKCWYVFRWSITNDSLLDDGFSCRTLVDPVAPPAFFFALHSMDYDQLYMEFNIGAARQVCLGAEVRSRAEHELELKEKLRVKYVDRGRLLEEKDLEILKLKSELAEKEAEAAEVIRLRDQVSSLSEEKSALTAKVSAIKITVTQKYYDISLLKSHATSLASTLDDAKEQQAQELYNRVAKLKAHVMDVSGHLEGELYPTYLTTLAGRRWLLTHGIQLALLKCLKSFEYQGYLGHALGMQEGIEAGHEYRIARRSLSVVDAYNPEAAKARYVDVVKALEDVDFPLVSLLKSKKDARIDEVLDGFLLDGPLACLSEAAYLQPCIKQLSIPIHHARDATAIGETSLSFALMNVHARVEGAKNHVVALRYLMMDIVSAPLSSQT
ncbi:hypothetical protein Tco_0918218 [Tanacetum coccineum]